MNNIEIRLAMAKAGIRQWQVAELMGITEQAFSKKLRRELPQAEQEQIVKLIANKASA